MHKFGRSGLKIGALGQAPKSAKYLNVSQIISFECTLRRIRDTSLMPTAPRQRSHPRVSQIISQIITGSIAHSASRRYLVYSEADFEVFRLAGATRCTDGGEIWHEGGTWSPTPCQI